MGEIAIPKRNASDPRHILDDAQWLQSSSGATVVGNIDLVKKEQGNFEQGSN